jgi:LEA14-like dessication related protein
MMKIKTCVVISFTLVVLGLIISCKTVNPTEPEKPMEEIKPLISPISTLTFEKIEAENTETLFLTFKLDVDNTTSHDANLLFQNPTLSINGNFANESLFSLELPKQETLMKQEQKSISLHLVFHASEYERNYQADFDEYAFSLTLPVQYIFPDETIETFANAEVNFPRIRKPDFNITEIKIVQAELINTRLKVSIQVDNPNHFSVELTSFNYELYGDGRFWARGEETDLLNIPAKDSAEIDLFLTMNFTNMRRNVLDQVIKMTEVRYRFNGNAAVETGISYLPHFIMDFEHQGNSDVIR